MNPYQPPNELSKPSTLRANVSLVDVPAILLCTVPTSSVVGGITFGITAFSLEYIVTLGDSALPAAAFTGLAAGSVASLIAWLLARTFFAFPRSRPLTQVNMGDVLLAALAALVVSPLAGFLGIATLPLFGLIMEASNRFENLLGTIAISISATLFFVVVITAAQFTLEWRCIKRAAKFNTGATA